MGRSYSVDSKWDLIDRAAQAMSMSISISPLKPKDGLNGPPLLLGLIGPPQSLPTQAKTGLEWATMLFWLEWATPTSWLDGPPQSLPTQAKTGLEWATPLLLGLIGPPQSLPTQAKTGLEWATRLFWLEWATRRRVRLIAFSRFFGFGGSFSLSLRGFFRSRRVHAGGSRLGSW